jgi:hypothetical protein
MRSRGPESPRPYVCGLVRYRWQSGQVDCVRAVPHVGASVYRRSPPGAWLVRLRCILSREPMIAWSRIA